VEGEFLTGETDIRDQARMISDLGPKEIVLSHRNGIFVFAEGPIKREIGEVEEHILKNYQ
jgi:hypothetical protein